MNVLDTAIVGVAQAIEIAICPDIVWLAAHNCWNAEGSRFLNSRGAVLGGEFGELAEWPDSCRAGRWWFWISGPTR